MKHKSIIIKQLHFSYIPQEKVLAIPEMQITSGTVTVILGGNGTGKTTMLKLMGGILNAPSGCITLPKNESIIYIHQNPYMLSGTVEQNIRLLLKDSMRSIAGNPDPERIKHVLCRMGLDNYAKRQVHKLSGGEKKRAAIACALLADRDIVLMDEPTAHLDEQSVLHLEELVKELRNRGKTVILATHDQAFAYRLADEVFQLEHGVPIVFDYNYLHGYISRTDEYFSYFSCGGVELKVVPARESVNTAVIDSKDIIISRHPLDSSAQNTHAGVVTHIEERENTVILEVDCGFSVKSSITRRSADTLEIRGGAEVFVIFKTSAVRLY